MQDRCRKNLFQKNMKGCIQRIPQKDSQFHGEERRTSREEDQQREDQQRGGPAERRPAATTLYTELKDIFETTRDLNGKCDLFNQLISSVDMNQSFERMPPITPLYPIFIAEIRKHTVKKKQFALAYIILKNGEYEFFTKIVPQKPNRGSMLHTEKLLKELIDKFLLENGNNVRQILMYTYNSPCLKRKDNNITSCMSLLFETADHWCVEYGIITDVGFTKICNSNYFTEEEKNDISGYSRIVHLYKSKPFRLKSSKFKCCQSIFQIIPKVQNKTGLKDNIESAIKKIKEIKEMDSSCSRTYDEHLLYGTQQIAKLTFPKDVEQDIFKILNNSWKKMVEDSQRTEIDVKIADDFNIAAVKRVQDCLLKCDLGSKSPLRLFWVPEDELEREYV